MGAIYKLELILPVNNLPNRPLEACFHGLEWLVNLVDQHGLLLECTDLGLVELLRLDNWPLDLAFDQLDRV